MNEDIKRIGGITRRLRAAINTAAALNPDDAKIKAISDIAHELCGELTDLLKTHGPKVGISDVTANAVTAPKD